MLDTRKQLPAAVRRKVLARGVCSQCNTDMHNSQSPPFEIDHIVPLALGGTDDLSNLRLLCQPCHKAKTKHDLRMIRKADRGRRNDERRAQQARNRPRRPAFQWMRRWKRKVDGTVVRRDSA